MIILFLGFLGLRLYVPLNIFSVMLERFAGLNQYKAMKMKYLVQGHNTAPLVRFEPTTLHQESGILLTELMVLPSKRPDSKDFNMILPITTTKQINMKFLHL